MINLIPPIGEAILKRDYLLRVGSTAGFLMGSVFLVLAGSLIPTYVLTSSQIQEYETKLSGTEDVAQAYTDAENEVESSKILLTQLKTPEPAYLTSNLIKDVESMAPAGVVFKSFHTNTNERTGDTFIVQGTASTREVLIQFKNGLKTIQRFEKAEVPISDLARDIDLPFSMTITLKKTL